jgi:hypothetical protein
MKYKVVFTFLFCALLTQARAQSFPNRVTPPIGSGDPMENDDNIQAKFLRQEWSPGIVKFKSGRDIMHVPLIFDVDNNKVYYQESNNIMEFQDSVSEFVMKVIHDHDSTFQLFRNGYPTLQNNSTATFYEVVVDGNIQLLKCRARSIYMFKDAELDQRKAAKELWFAYLPGNKLVLIKKDLDNILKQMPAYATQIQQIVDKNKLKLKSDKKLKELFTKLNQPE